MVRSASVCAAMIAAVAVSEAVAAPPWSAPVTVSRPATFLDRPFIGFGADGRALLTWHIQNGIGDDLREDWRAATRRRDGTFGSERSVPYLSVPPVVYGQDRVAMVSVDAQGLNRARVRVAFGTTSGRFGRLRRIDTIVPGAGPVLAANARGRVALAYGQRLRGRGRVVTLVERRPGRRFGAPRVVRGTTGARTIAVAVGRRGALVLAWERRGSVHARVRPPGGRLGPVVRLARSPRLPEVLRAAVTRRGAIWVAWAVTRESEVGFDTPYQVRFALRPAGADRFRPARQLTGDGRLAGRAGMDLAVDPGGRAFVAWSGWDGERLRARLATIAPGGRAVTRRTLSRPGYDAAVQELATSRRRGEALASWVRLDAAGEVGTQVLAGLIEPGGRYAGEEPVSEGEGASQPWAAFDPLTGAPTMVWSQRIGPVESVLRASTRG